MCPNEVLREDELGGDLEHIRRLRFRSVRLVPPKHVRYNPNNVAGSAGQRTTATSRSFRDAISVKRYLSPVWFFW